MLSILPQSEPKSTGETGAAGASGCSGNTNLTNCATSTGFGASQSVETHPKDAKKNAPLLLRQSFDGVEFSLSAPSELKEQLAEQVESYVGQGQQTFDSHTFVVSRVGGFVWTYKLQFTNGVEIRIPGLHQLNKPINVRVGAKACVLLPDIYSSVVELLSWFLVLPVEVFAPWLSVSRVDLATDVLMPEKEFQRLCRHVGTISKRVVSRAKYMHPFIEDGRYTGVQIGKNDVVLRIYDKQKEAVQGNDWAFWSEVYGNGEAYRVAEGYVIARFEYQIRREALRSFSLTGVDGVQTWHDWQVCLPAVVQYLSDSWFKLAYEATGKRHERVTMPLWSRIALLIQQGGWSNGVGERLRRMLRRHVAVNVQRVAQMALGCLATLSAATARTHHQKKALSLSNTLIELKRFLGNDVNKWKVKADQRMLAMAYDASWRSVAVSPVGY